jgi:oxygen-independent coproporphyrinogen-3 oxidase
MTPDFSKLLEKYNVPAPRYTSYPTVPYWETTPSEEEWVCHLTGALDENASQGIGAALYLHIPFCERLCSFCGCNTRITKNHMISEPYIAGILKEWQLYKSRVSPNKSLLTSEIHMGGGTPTFLSPRELGDLLGPLLKDITVTEHHEFSIEADPRVTTKDHFAALQGLGFRRVSLGVQDFSKQVQQAINRVQSFAQVRQCTEWARASGFTSVNFDLIYGLPFQSVASIRDTFAKVTDLRPDRIAFYAYAHVPWIKPTQRKFTEKDLPDAAIKRELYEVGRQLLEEYGYKEIGMDHFALTSDSLWQASQDQTLHRNFMGYLPRHVSPLIGLGVSAISDSWSAFIQNEKILEKYLQQVAKGSLPILRGHVLTKEDQIIRKHILNLMTRFETTWNNDDDESLKPLDLQDKLQVFVDDELIELEGSGLRINDSGRAFIRNISMAFDARLARALPQNNLFSKSI